MLEEKIEQWYIKYGKKITLFMSVIIIIYLVGRLRLISLFAPFIIAWLFATGLNHVVTWSHKALGLHRGVGTIISMLTILSGVLTILGVILKKLWEQMLNFSKMIPNTTDQVITQMNGLEERLGWTLQLLPGGKAMTNLDSVVQQVMNSLSDFLSSIIPVAYDAVSKVPNVILFIITMLLSTFFMTKDYYKIKDFIKAQFSDTIVDKIVIMQHGMLEAIGGYIRTQVILMSITFSICFIGLFIFDVNYALLLAVIISIVDALPVFGSGTILIPWGIYTLLIGNYTLGIGLLCIYGIIFVARQIMEPKILSTQIGMYALVTLMSVYIGYKIIGFIGLILGPAIVVILQMLQNVGALPKFKPVIKREGEKNENYTGRKHSRSS